MHRKRITRGPQKQPPQRFEMISPEIATRTRRLPSSASSYTLRQQIGQGTSSAVFRALCEPLNDEVAIKVIDLESVESSLENILREIHVMSLSSHPNLVPLSTVFLNGAHLWIVMPILTDRSVLDLIHDSYPTGLSEAHAVYVLWSLLKAIDYFHRNNQIHRNVKAANVLLDSKGNVMLSDYCMMSWMVEGGWERKQRETLVGAPCWMAPEVMEQTHGYDYKADIWSLGITAIEIAQGMAPYSNAPALKVLIMTLQHPPPVLNSEYAAKFSNEYQDFIASCLKKDPSERLTAAELLNHPLFAKGVEKPKDLEDLITKPPHIGTRGGAGQKQLYKELTKAGIVSWCGSWEPSSRMQPWDFGDVFSDASSDSFVSVGHRDESGPGGNTFAMATAEKTISLGSLSTTSMPAKTLGIFRRGRFTVSDVTVPDKEAPHGTGGNSATQHANASGSYSLHSQGTDGKTVAESSAAAGPATTGQNRSQPIVIPTQSELSGNSTMVSIASPAPNARAGNVPSRQGQQSLPLERDASRASTQATSSHPGPPVTSTPRKSRFEVSDVEISDIKSTQTAAIPSTVSSSGGCIPFRAGTTRAFSKPRCEVRFEVKDIDNVTLATAPYPSVGAVRTVLPPREKAKPAPVPQQPTPPFQLQTGRKLPLPSLAPPLVQEQARQTQRPPVESHPVESVPLVPVVPSSPMSRFSAEANSPNEDPAVPVVHAPSVPFVAPPAFGSVTAVPITPGTQIDAMKPGCVPQSRSTNYVSPQEQSPLPPQVQAPSTQQSTLESQGPSNVADLHSSILSQLQDAGRIVQDNECLRGALRTLQTQQQLQQTQIEQMHYQIEKLQLQVQQQQLVQQLQQLQQEQQLIQQKQKQLQQQQHLQQQQQLQQQYWTNIPHLHTAPFDYPVVSQTRVNSAPTSGYVPAAQTATVQNTNQYSLPNPSLLYSHEPGPADSSSTTQTQMSSQQRTHANSSAAPAVTSSNHSAGNLHSAVPQENSAQFRLHTNSSPSAMQYHTVQSQWRPKRNPPTLGQSRASCDERAAPISTVPATLGQCAFEPAVMSSAPVLSGIREASDRRSDLHNNWLPVSSHQVPVSSHELSSHRIFSQEASHRSSLLSSVHPSTQQVHAPVSATSARMPSISQSISTQTATSSSIQMPVTSAISGNMHNVVSQKHSSQTANGLPQLQKQAPTVMKQSSSVPPSVQPMSVHTIQNSGCATLSLNQSLFTNHTPTLVNSSPISNVTVAKGRSTSDGEFFGRGLNSQPSSVHRIAPAQQQSVQLVKPALMVAPTRKAQYEGSVQHSPPQQSLKPHRQLASTRSGIGPHQAKPEEPRKVQIVHVQAQKQMRAREQSRLLQTNAPPRNDTASDPAVGKTHHGHSARPQHIQIPAATFSVGEGRALEV